VATTAKTWSAEAREEEIRHDALAEHHRRTHTNQAALLWCEVCDEGIPLQRRLAVPGVRMCTSCQARHEQQQKRGLAA
jgi:phage/conjugal plasmid C-4 type zinc finger TraR family protein